MDEIYPMNHAIANRSRIDNQGETRTVVNAADKALLRFRPSNKVTSKEKISKYNKIINHSKAH